MPKKLIDCQCDDPVCGKGSPCPRLATAEDLRCDVCRGASAEQDPVYGPFRAWTTEWVEPGPIIAWPYNGPPQ